MIWRQFLGFFHYITLICGHPTPCSNGALISLSLSHTHTGLKETIRCTVSACLWTRNTKYTTCQACQELWQPFQMPALNCGKLSYKWLMWGLWVGSMLRVIYIYICVTKGGGGTEGGPMHAHTVRLSIFLINWDQYGSHTNTYLDTWTYEIPLIVIIFQTC